MVWSNVGGLWRRSCGAVGTGVGGTLGGREMAAGAGRFGIVGTRVARLSRVTILSKAFFVSSPASRNGRFFGGFSNIATMSSTAWRRRSSVFTEGDGK